MNMRQAHAALLHACMVLALAMLFAPSAACAEDAAPPAQHTAPSTASAPSGSQPPSAAEWYNDDADLPAPPNYGDCNSVPHPARLSYDFSRGSMNNYPKGATGANPSLDTSQRLILKADCVGMLIEDLDAHINDPRGTTTITSLGVIVGGESEFWGGYVGLGESYYRAMGQGYAMFNIFMHLQGHIVANLSAEMYFAMPFQAFFVGNNVDPNDPAMNGAGELGLRMDWRYMALRAGVRTMQVSYTTPGATTPSSVSRGGGYLALTLKY